MDVLGREGLDHTVFSRFRNLLHEKALSERLFVVAGVVDAGERGTLIDAAYLEEGKERELAVAHSPEGESTSVA